MALSTVDMPDFRVFAGLEYPWSSYFLEGEVRLQIFKIIYLYNLQSLGELRLPLVELLPLILVNLLQERLRRKFLYLGRGPDA